MLRDDRDICKLQTVSTINLSGRAEQANIPTPVVCPQLLRGVELQLHFFLVPTNFEPELEPGKYAANVLINHVIMHLLLVNKAREKNFLHNNSKLSFKRDYFSAKLFISKYLAICSSSSGNINAPITT